MKYLLSFVVEEEGMGDARVREPRRGDRVGEQDPTAVRRNRDPRRDGLSQYGYESKTLTPAKATA